MLTNRMMLMKRSYGGVRVLLASGDDHINTGSFDERKKVLENQFIRKQEKEMLEAQLKKAMKDRASTPVGGDTTPAAACAKRTTLPDLETSVDGAFTFSGEQVVTVKEVLKTPHRLVV